MIHNSVDYVHYIEHRNIKIHHELWDAVMVYMNRQLINHPKKEMKMNYVYAVVYSGSLTRKLLTEYMEKSD